MHPIFSALSLVLFLLAPAAGHAFDGDKHPELAQEAASENHFQNDSPSNHFPDKETPEENDLDQATPIEESVTDESAYDPEQSPEYIQHVTEASQSCEKSANDTELAEEDRERFIKDCLQSQGAL